MSKPTLYGVSGSRAIRSIWAMEETGIDYDHVATHFFEDSKTDDFLAVNPNGRIPALVDGDLVLFESMAINLYLLKKYAPALYPDNAADEARALQWSVWGISEIEPLQMQIVVQKIFTPKEKRNAKVIENAAKGLERPLAVLDAALAKSPYLLGADFSVADLNVAAVMNLLLMIKHDFSSHTNVQRWADACYARPALAAAQARD
ncbi:MAG: glutathione S-transferase family protein [Pseudomonadales bacterium]